jgi:hypothetical protein
MVGNLHNVEATQQSAFHDLQIAKKTQLQLGEFTTSHKLQSVLPKCSQAHVEHFILSISE